MERSDSFCLGKTQFIQSSDDQFFVSGAKTRLWESKAGGENAFWQTVHVLCVNDFHATLQESSRGIGCAKLVAAIKEFKEQNPETIVVFGGDNYFTDPISEHFCGEPVTQMMRELQTVASVIGNHEFYYAAEQLTAWQTEGGYVFLGANICSRITGEPASFVRPYWIGARGGIKIALIGLTTGETIDRDDFAPGMEQYRISDGVESANRWIQYLRDGKDPLGEPDVIIALTHYGLRTLPDGTLHGPELIDLCQSVTGIAGVFSAHWHQFIKTYIHDIPVASGGSSGRGYAVLSIRISEDNRIIDVIPDSVDLMPDRLALPEDSSMKQKLQGYYEQSEPVMNRVLGYAEAEMIHRDPVSDAISPEGTPLSLLITRVMMETGRYRAALFYSGRIGKGFKKGAITWYDFCKTVLFLSRIIAMKLSGGDLIRNIEAGLTTLKGEGASPLAVSGVLIEADYSKPYGERLIRAVFADQTAILADEIYDVVVDGFLAGSPFGYDFSNGRDQVLLRENIRDLLFQEIMQAKTISGERPDNIRLVRRGMKGSH